MSFHYQSSFLAGVEFADQCLINSKVLSCFSGVIMSIRSFFSALSVQSSSLMLFHHKYGHIQYTKLKTKTIKHYIYKSAYQ